MHRNDVDAEDALPVRWATRQPLRANPNVRDSRQCGTYGRSPLPLIPSPSGEGTGAGSLRAAASGSDGRCLSCLDRRIVSYGCAAAIDGAADDGCIAPTKGGALDLSKRTTMQGATKKAHPARE